MATQERHEGPQLNLKTWCSQQTCWIYSQSEPATVRTLNSIRHRKVNF